MFENILTKETVSFKDLEEIAFKIACEFANDILRNMLEEYDKKIMNTRDTNEFRHKGKETTTVYQEVDGKMIYTQGKDRKEQREKYKEQHPNEEVPKKSKKLSKVELRVLNSDGGSWIKKLLVKKAIYQADSYHLKEKIIAHVRNAEDVEILKTMFYKKEYSQMIEYVETLKYKYDGEVEEVEKLNELQRYLNKRKDTMKRYKDYDGVKANKKNEKEKNELEQKRFRKYSKRNNTLC